MASAGPPYVIEHTLTAADVVEAGRLARRGLMRVGRLIGALLLVVGALLVVVVDWLIGVVAMGAGAATLWTAAFPTVDRWLAGWQLRGVLGGSASSVIDAGGIDFVNPHLSGHIEWSNLTHAVENDRILLLMRDRTPVAYIPVSALGDSRIASELTPLPDQKHGDRQREDDGDELAGRCATRQQPADPPEGKEQIEQPKRQQQAGEDLHASPGPVAVHAAHRGVLELDHSGSFEAQRE
jgi:hypothetical protein